MPVLSHSRQLPEPLARMRIIPLGEWRPPRDKNVPLAGCSIHRWPSAIGAAPPERAW